MEVKKRILNSTPHMGGKKLKVLSRKHARKGTMDSFVAGLESRLDRFLLRCNLVPTIFAARMAIGHKHILVNGRPTNRCGLILDPMAIVEPKPSSKHMFRRMVDRRFINNTFVFANRANSEDDDDDDAGVEEVFDANGALVQKAMRAQGKYDLERLGSEAAQPPAHRLPPPARAPSWSSSADDDKPKQHAQALLRTDLETMILSVLPALAEDGAATQLRAKRAELLVDAPAQVGSDAPPISISLRDTAGGGEPLVLLDRVKTRRLLLALLALKPAVAEGVKVAP